MAILAAMTFVEYTVVHYMVAQKPLLLATVFITGAAVLIFEVAAIRLLSPYYGSSLTVVSSVLSVILLALSLGYYFGGTLADRYPYPAPLALLIGLGGVTLLGLTLLALTTLPTLAPTIGFTSGPLLIAIVFFFIPAALLGIDSPYVSKILAQGSDQEGSIVGTVFFMSTIGSIIGSLASGFYLIPQFGLTNTLLGTAIVIILWSLLVYFLTTTPSWRRSLGSLIVLGVTTSGTLYAAALPESSRGTLIYARDGLYSKLVVYDEMFDDKTYRFLKNDTNFSSAIIKDSYELAFSYTTFALAYDLMVPQAQHYLVLGGGAYTVPRHLHHHDPDLIVDTVELEPYLLPIAETYFDLPQHPHLRHHTADARVFLNSTTTQYDVIFSDVMNSGLYIPPHLLTAEFFTLVQSRLAPDGVAMFNYAGSLDTNGESMTGSLVHTIASIFPNYRLYPLQHATGANVQNIMIVVRHDEKPITFGDHRVENTLQQTYFRIDDRSQQLRASTLTDERLFTDDSPGMEPLLAKQMRLHGAK